MDDKVRLYRRAEGGRWHCSTFIDGKEYRKTTKRKDLAAAKEFAVAWYKAICDGLGVKHRVGKSFAETARVFEQEYETINQGRRSGNSIRGHKDRLRLHLVPYFGGMPVEEITAGTVQDYRAHRLTEPGHDGKGDDGKDIGGEAKPWRSPARSTIHNEIVTLRMVLKAAQRYGWIETIPDLSDPYQAKTKTEPRTWFTPEEFAALCEATGRNAARPKNGRYKWHAEQLHDFVLLMAHTGLRPDEANMLVYRDVTIVDDDDNGARILEIALRGRRGADYCRSMPGAVPPFERMRARNRPKPGDRLFPTEYKKMFNRILTENNLKFDRNGKARTAYSLRHTYICFRLLEGADIYQIAKNCRTSVEMIEKYYASHIATTLDASAINVRRPKRKDQSKEDDSGRRLDA
ncbi:hypothetical protein [Iodidimonas sp. MBR-22]|uniref:tyrosine-type recombinase/integrase n=1 Tax=Iodidimonas sp. MBR-22 TaxID=3032320 RepID=UPI00248289F8|nr:hypothetical protein [Iodidimonas sp. MBR-22]